MTLIFHVAPNHYRASIHFESDRLYQHKVLRINYTTYDMRRAQDSINPRTHPFIMLYSPDPTSKHPYWYAQVIHIFHAHVKRSRDKDYTRMDFLRVRWFGVDTSSPGGFDTQRLHSLGFISSAADGPFGFIDPKHVIRASHLIPHFSRGRTQELLGPSSIRKPDDQDEDWDGYYVNMHVDRDMFMRYLGGGVGHAESERLRNQDPPQTNLDEHHLEVFGVEADDESEGLDVVELGPMPEDLDTSEQDSGLLDDDDEDEEDEEIDVAECSEYGDDDPGEEGKEDEQWEDVEDDEISDDELGPEDGEENLDEEEEYGDNTKLHGSRSSVATDSGMVYSSLSALAL
ncbi:hypothetical protein K474DRAFT_952383 [Panus rudis PR-1116 ss-1]|nr:hypothetical protein K474DRAFT_952383 [Panus rudis PR-1116 ss-1]